MDINQCGSSVLEAIKNTGIEASRDVKELILGQNLAVNRHYVSTQ